MDYLPIFLDIKDRTCLVVGGGKLLLARPPFCCARVLVSP
jgi:siroheme synthase (precorrin-2 oxidase/ferrochelatase)